MTRTLLLGLATLATVGLGACRSDDNAADRRERSMSNDRATNYRQDRAMVDDRDGVWFNANGERVRHADLFGPNGGNDWYSNNPDDQNNADNRLDHRRDPNCSSGEKRSQ